MANSSHYSFRSWCRAFPVWNKVIWSRSFPKTAWLQYQSSCALVSSESGIRSCFLHFLNCGNSLVSQLVFLCIGAQNLHLLRNEWHSFGWNPFSEMRSACQLFNLYKSPFYISLRTLPRSLLWIWESFAFRYFVSKERAIACHRNVDGGCAHHHIHLVVVRYFRQILGIFVDR